MKYLNRHKYSVLITVSFLLICLTAIQARAVQLSAESKTGQPGDRIQIAVRTDNTTGLGIISVQFVLTFNGNLLTARSASTVGTIASNWGAPTFNPQTGQISISMASATPLSGSGDLVIVEFDVASSATAGQTTQLNITNLQLNEGSVPATVLPGTFTVTGDGGGEVTLTVGSANATPGALVTIPVSISEVTGLGIISMQMDLDFDSSLLTAANVSNTGTLTEPWGAPTVNIEPGKVRISMAIATPLSGAGNLFLVTFTVSSSATNGQSDTLSLSQVNLNEGAVPAKLVDGVITIGQPGETVKLMLPSMTAAKPGASIFVPLSIAKATGRNIIAVSLSVTYPSSFATAAEVSLSNGVVPGWSVAFNDNNGKIMIAVAGTSAIPMDGELFRIRFDIKSNAAYGSSDSLKIQDVTLNDGSIPFVVQNGILKIQDNFEISGAVRYYFNNQGIRNVTMQLSGDESRTLNTASDGTYRFENLGSGNYVLAPGKDGDISTNVISPFDASMILRHVVGSLNLTSDQKIAADVDGNDIVQALDAAFILQYFVSIITQFPVGDDWAFVPKNLSYAPLSSSLSNQDFKAIAYGDVSGNYSSALSFQKQVLSEVGVSLPDTVVNENSMIDIALRIEGNNSGDIFSFGGKITFNPTVLKFNEARTQGTIAAGWGNPTVKSGMSEVVFAHAGASSLQGDGEILRLTFEVTGACGDTSGLYLRDFAFNEGSPSADIHSGFVWLCQRVAVEEAVHEIPRALYLWPNFPNPVPIRENQRVITTITFQVTQFGRGTVSIYNVQGQLVRRLVDQPFAPGIHQVTWDGRDEIGHDVAAGTYLYRLQMANDVHTRKLILVR